MSKLDNIFAFTDLYIVLDDWESSYCYYAKDKNNIRKNNPARLISEDQKPYIKNMMRAYKKRKLEVLSKEMKVGEVILSKLFNGVDVNDLIKNEFLEKTNIGEEKIEKLLKKIDIDFKLHRILKRNIDKYISEENTVITESVKDMSFEFMGRGFRTYEMNAKNGRQIVCRQTFNKEIKLYETGIKSDVVKYLLSPKLASGGLIIICGTNGSGKSTTCAGLVKERLVDFGGYCITIEEPIEIKIEGQHGDGRCIQLEVSSSEGFSDKIRQITRAYPTGQNLIMMVGEVRDSETASQVLRAAINGCLVITTVHSDNVINAMNRMLTLASDNLTVDSAKDLLSNSLRMVVHQSLKSGEMETNFVVGTKEVSMYIKRGQIDNMATEIERQQQCLKLGKEIKFGE